MEVYEKPHINHQQQITQMQRRGLLFKNEKKALNVLQHIQYYRLSGYLHHFRQVNPNDVSNRFENYIDGIYFENVFDLYCFDKKLRILLMDAIESIETALRTQIAYELGAVDPYILDNPQLFKNEHHFNNFVNERTSCWSRSHDTFVQHFKRKYNNKPIWVEVETWTMGTITTFLNKVSTTYFREHHEDRYYNIAKNLGAKDIHALKRWVTALRFIRNKCAHHGRIWNMIHRDIEIKQHERNLGSAYVQAYQNAIKCNFSTSRLYFQCLVIWQILKRVNPDSKWNNRLYSLIKNNFPKDVPFVGLENMGFPPDWHTQKFWRL